jgi:hypothetical protein
MGTTSSCDDAAVDTMTRTRATATVNGQGPFRATWEITQDVQYARSMWAVKPDPAWQHTDPAGHFHAFDHEGGLPTLDVVYEHVDCDGSCGGACEDEGYTTSRYECVACRAPVEPSWVPDHQAREQGIPIPGLRDWKARLVGALDQELLQPGDGRVSVVIQDGDLTLFGFGIVCDSNAESCFGGTRMTMTLAGAGPLSRRA